MLSAFVAILVIVAVVLLWFVAIYNKLIKLRNMKEEGWSGIDVQLKRRANLIPNLIESVKGYMGHEKSVLEGVTKLRSQAMNASNVGDKMAAESALSGMLGKFFALAENYPDLKANQNFLAIQEELTGTENKISFARQSYNDQVLFFNNKIQMFPSNIVAGMFSFGKRDFFEIENAAEREVPKVSF